jgi:hypothetical protein
MIALDAAREREITNTTDSCRFVLGLISTNREGTKRYFHFDGLGSTWALTDENENVTDNYSYSAFGVTVSATSTNGPSTNPMRFGGRWGYYDDGAMGSSSGLLYRSGRYLNASSGTYQSPPVPIHPPDDWEPSNPFSWWHYGNFCGAANVKPPGQGFKPLDCLDLCCLKHDRCIEAHAFAGYSGGCQHYCCDCGLLHCAEAVLVSGCCADAPSPFLCAQAAADIVWSFIRLCGFFRLGIWCPDCIPGGLHEHLRLARFYWYGVRIPPFVHISPLL